MTRRPFALTAMLCALCGPALAGDGAKEQVGAASYYGDRFHGRRTASGERHDKAGLTAAHPDAPMNSVLEVTNLDNGKTVRVRVNDRGPFTPGRIIDLSRAAAERLDMIRKGIARVRVRRVDPAEADAAPDAGLTTDDGLPPPA